MSNKIIRANDSIGSSDNILNFRGEVIFGKGRKTIPFTDPFGNESYRSEFEEVLYKAKNIVPIGGYQFAFSKLFNIGLDQESTLRVGDLNDEAPQMKIGIPRSKYISTTYNAECSTEEPSPTVPGINISALNFIFGFMIGDGGSREDNTTAIAPSYKNRTLYHAIPFRMSNDGYPIQAGKYFGKTETYSGSSGQEAITSYFIKLFNKPAPHIVHSWVTDKTETLEIVDDSVFTSTSSYPIESYVEMNLEVSEKDGRGYFESTNTTPRINEFSLVSGWFNTQLNDYEQLRMFTHFTRPSLTLAEGDTIEIIYRLYAR